jgi:predicted outer membrane lipoprotein
VSVERAKEQLELSEGRWESAIREHAQPPPDAGFVRRLRALADAAAQEQAAYRYAADQGFGWRPGPAWLPPHELRPAPWRESLAPAEVWERFDEAVEGLSRARTGLSVAAISQAFGILSAAAWELADAVDRARQRSGATDAA